MTIIDKAIDNLYTHGWGQGSLQNWHTGEMCLLGALGCPNMDDARWAYENEEARLLAETIVASCWKCRHYSPDQADLGYPAEVISVIWRHNDRHLRDRDEAISLLKEVANDSTS